MYGPYSSHSTLYATIRYTHIYIHMRTLTIVYDILLNMPGHSHTTGSVSDLAFSLAYLTSSV